MKAGLFTLAAVALQLTVAQPHGPRQRHRHHQRQAVVEMVDIITEEIVVYVDEAYNPISTATTLVTAPPLYLTSSFSSTLSSSSSSVRTTTTTPTSAASSTSTTLATSTSMPPPPPSSTSAPPPPHSSSSSSAYTPPASTAPAAPVSQAPSTSASAAAPSKSATGPSSSGPSFSKGVTYSPYNKDNTCKGAKSVATDLSGISGYDLIRIYGTDCGQVGNVVSAIKGTGISLLVGIFDITNIPSEAQTIIQAVNGDWSSIKAINVGNELVDTGAASVSQVVAAMSQARSILRAAGFTGPVVTVDTMVAMKNNPKLCTESDIFCAINCHAFFDNTTEASGAGAFVQGWMEQVSKAAGGKMVIVTESGWPAKGNSNGAAVPSPENQSAALSSITSAVPSNVVLYSLYNMLWKAAAPATFNAEPWWGMKGTPKSGAINTS